MPDRTTASGARIVVVDDDAQLREVVGLALSSRAGFSVVGTGSTGEEGVEVVDALEPDAVVLDLAMPGQGGQWAATEMLRRHPGLAIVVLSAHVGRSLERELLAAGVRAVLRKGGSIGELLDLVEQVARRDA
jgi:DNA-binding NarL/FixJ family response regulator